jgi:endonuclease/exonuclease/phosphatase (EEP) superfamily protein YafD
MGAVATVATLCGLAGRYGWLFDLASHFRVQYCIALVVVAAGLSIVRKYKIAIFFGAVALFNLALVIPFYVGADHGGAAQARSLRALLVNVYTSNRDHAAVLDSIERHDPDFVVAEEVNQRWMSVLDTLSQRYPYVVSRPREDNFGIVLLSKHPIVDSTILSLSAIDVPSILAEFKLQGKRFFLLATHTLPPVSSEYARFRNDERDSVVLFLSAAATRFRPAQRLAWAGSSADLADTHACAVDPPRSLPPLAGNRRHRQTGRSASRIGPLSGDCRLRALTWNIVEFP